MEIPVYLFTGFLEAGKTRLVQETMEDSDFNAGEPTLILLCEDKFGVEITDEDIAKFVNVGDVVNFLEENAQ